MESLERKEKIMIAFSLLDLFLSLKRNELDNLQDVQDKFMEAWYFN